MDERELQQELLNYAVGSLENIMYDTLGRKVDALSETDLLDELENLATLKTGTEVQAVDYPAIFKRLTDQFRLMTAILGEGWGRLSSKPMDMSKVAKKPMVKHGDDRHADQDEDTSAEVTEETGVINSKDVWTAL